MLVIIREISRFIKWNHFIGDLKRTFKTVTDYVVSWSLTSISYGRIHISVLWNAVNLSFHVAHRIPWSYLSFSFILWRYLRLKVIVRFSRVRFNQLVSYFGPFYRFWMLIELIQLNVRIIGSIKICSTASIEPPTRSIFVGAVTICVGVIIIIKSREILSLMSCCEHIISWRLPLFECKNRKF